MKDILGRPLSYGDRVAFALHYGGTQVVLCLGTVMPHGREEIKRWADLYVRVSDERGRWSGLKAPDQLLLVEQGAGEFIEDGD